MANYFRVLQRPQWVIMQYDVRMEPDLKGRALRKELVSNHAPFKEQLHLFDGGFMLYTANKLLDEHLV